MDDMISRQAAIDGLDGHYTERRNLNDWQAGWNAALDWMGSTYLDEFPSAQFDKDIDVPSNDTISRQAAIDAVHKEFDGCLVWDESGETTANAVEEILDNVPSVQPERKTGEWMPFKTRPLTNEEREEHPEWDCIIVGPIPDDGQRILVSINLKGHEEVQFDEFYSDDGSYLDSGYEIGSEAVAWMPLPEPYKKGEQDD